MANSDILDKMMRFEAGDMEQEEVIEFSHEMVNSGLWSLCCQSSSFRAFVAERVRTCWERVHR